MMTHTQKREDGRASRRIFKSPKDFEQELHPTVKGLQNCHALSNYFNLKFVRNRVIY